MKLKRYTFVKMRTFHVMKRDYRYDNPGHIYIGRSVPNCGLKGSIWENPFKIGQTVNGKKLTRENVIELHQRYITALIQTIPEIYDINEFRNPDGSIKKIFCWCTEDEPCHGDTYIDILEGKIPLNSKFINLTDAEWIAIIQCMHIEDKRLFMSTIVNGEDPEAKRKLDILHYLIPKLVKQINPEWLEKTSYKKGGETR